jgi:hypothetical protein
MACAPVGEVSEVTFIASTAPGVKNIPTRNGHQRKAPGNCLRATFFFATFFLAMGRVLSVAVMFAALQD